MFGLGGQRQSKSKPVPRRRLSDQSVRPKEPLADSANRAPAFRRNRTITGSTSKAMGSAAEASGGMQSPRARAHHLRRQRRHLGGMLALGLGGAVIVAVALSQFTAEVSVAVVGQVRPLTDEQRQRIELPIEDYLASRPFERLRPLLNQSNLVAHLQSSGARDVERVADVAGDGFGKAVFQVKVREPVARWTIAGQPRFVDRSGVVFSVNHFDRPTVTISDESGISADSEAAVQAVTSGRFLAFVGQTDGLLEGHGVKVDSVVIPPGTTRQVEVMVDGGRPVSIKMTIDRPAGEQAEDAARAYRHLAGEGVAVRYIDVRVSGIAHYRPR